MKKRINARKKTIDAINVAIAETFENGDDLNVFNVHSRLDFFYDNYHVTESLIRE